MRRTTTSKLSRSLSSGPPCGNTRNGHFFPAVYPGGNVAMPSSLIPSFDIQSTTCTSPGATLRSVSSPSCVMVLSWVPDVTATLVVCCGSSTENATTSGEVLNAGNTGRPSRTPPGQRYIVSSFPRRNVSASVITPLCISTHTVPRGSAVTVVAVPASCGVRSTGGPPSTGTVQTCSGVKVGVVVAAKTISFPSSDQAIPLVPSGISASRREPLAPQIFTNECSSWKPIFGVCVITAISAESFDHAISVMTFKSGHHHAPPPPSAPTTYKLVWSLSTTVCTPSRGSLARESASIAKRRPSGEIVAPCVPFGRPIMIIGLAAASGTIASCPSLSTS